MDYLIAFAITIAIVLGISKIIFPKNSATSITGKTAKVAAYFIPLVIFIAASISLAVLLRIPSNAYAGATGWSLAISFLFFPITYTALKKQLKLDFSNIEMFVCFLIGVFAITVIKIFIKSSGEIASIISVTLEPLIVFAIIIHQFDVRKKAKVKSTRGSASGRNNGNQN